MSLIKKFNLFRIYKDMKNEIKELKEQNTVLYGKYHEEKSKVRKIENALGY